MVRPPARQGAAAVRPGGGGSGGLPSAALVFAVPSAGAVGLRSAVFAACGCTGRGQVCSCSLGIGWGAGESLDGDVCGRCSLLGGVRLHLSTSPCQMLWVKTQPILGWHRRRFRRCDLLEGDARLIRLAATAIDRVCYLFSSFLPPLDKIVAFVGAARVEDLIRSGRVCRGYGRRSNPTGHSESRPGSMSQSDLGSGDVPCL